MAIARGAARPWLANTFLVVLALVFSMCGADLEHALDVRTRGHNLERDIDHYTTAPCNEPRVTALEVPRLAKGRHYMPAVACVFTVEGTPHEATSEFTLITTYRTQDDAVAHAWHWLAQQHPLTAYYDPMFPEHATLSRDVNYAVTGDIIMAIGATLIALCLWFAIVRKVFLRVRAWRRKPPDEPIPGARVV